MTTHAKEKSQEKSLTDFFQKGFQAAKWARTNTGISKGQVNLGNVLCELARRIFGKVSNCRLLVVGAGEVAESAMEAFKSRDSEAITITGRTFDWCPLSRRNRMNWLKSLVVLPYPFQNSSNLFTSLMSF